MDSKDYMKNTKTMYLLVILTLLWSTSCSNVTRVTPSKFTPWLPKQIEKNVVLNELWTVDLDDYLGSSTTLDINNGVITKDYRYFSNSNKLYKVDQYGVKACNDLFEIEDINTEYKIQFHYDLFGNNSVRLLNSYGSQIWSVPNSIPDRMYIRDNSLYLLVATEHCISKVDILTGKKEWEHKFDYGETLLKEIAINKNYLFVNTVRRVPDDSKGVFGGYYSSYLVDEVTGKLTKIENLGNTFITTFGGGFYISIEYSILSKFDPLTLMPTGIKFDAKNVNRNAYFYNRPFIYMFTSDRNQKELYSINPITMESKKIDGRIRILDQYQLNEYLYYYDLSNKFVGISNKTSESTWIINKKGLEKGSEIVLGDERGILIRSGRKLICFGISTRNK